LDGWRRSGNLLEKIPEMAGFVSLRLGIRFEPGKGTDNLRIFGPDGTRFLTFTKWVEKSKADGRLAEAERQRAEAERQLAESERQRADAADRRAEEQTRFALAESLRADEERQRAERLAARLRELGNETE
jgi:hypothetical protein